MYSKRYVTTSSKLLFVESYIIQSSAGLSGAISLLISSNIIFTRVVEDTSEIYSNFLSKVNGRYKAIIS